MMRMMIQEAQKMKMTRRKNAKDEDTDWDSEKRYIQQIFRAFSHTVNHNSQHGDRIRNGEKRASFACFLCREFDKRGMSYKETEEKTPKTEEKRASFFSVNSSAVTIHRCQG